MGKEWMTPQDKWQKKVGYITKGFKIKKDIAEAYAEACEKADISQAGQMVKMMTEFIEKVR